MDTQGTLPQRTLPQGTPPDEFAKAYSIANVNSIHSPGLIIFQELLEQNLDQMVRIAGGPLALRPHAKTHKTGEITKMWLARGVTKHKCATIAEAEMLAREGVPDVLLAYQLIGPNLERWIRLALAYPRTRFGSLIDDPRAAEALGSVASENGLILPVMLDLDSGMHRTGILPGQPAIELYEMISSTDGLVPDGLHWYDGHHREPELEERRTLVLAGWDACLRFRDQLLMDGFEVPKIVAAGSGSFPILAETGEPKLELSPGTTVFFDADLKERFPEMPFRCALAILTRVVSRTGQDRLTLDVGHKSCAADQPAGHRLAFPELPDAREVQHSEEHLVIETGLASRFQLGDPIIAIPRHVCPTVAVHKFASIVERGAVTKIWETTARDRLLTI